METYDVVIIGAGHNALVCAAYLLKAGYTVLLLEKQPIPGGACTTEELLPQAAPGFKFNPCAIDHIFIHLGPVVAELELAKYGLDYRFCDPVVYCPHPDGKYFLAYHSLEKTCAEIGRYSPRDAQKYAEFIQFWQQVTGILTPQFQCPTQISDRYFGELRPQQIGGSVLGLGAAESIPGFPPHPLHQPTRFTGRIF